MAETRMIRRKLIDSEKFNSLSWAEQAFFTRLLLIADDYGLFDARPMMLLASLFPTRLDTMSVRDVQGYFRRCEVLGLIKGYSVKGKGYGMIADYGQVCKSKPKLPIPDGYEVIENPENKGKSKTYLLARIGSIQSDSSRFSPILTDALAEGVAVAEDGGVVEDGVVAEDAAARLVEKSLQPRSEARATPSFTLPKSSRDVHAVITARHIPLSQQDTEACAEMFFEEMESVGWVDAKQRPIRNWKLAASTYARRWANNIQSRALTKSKATGETNHQAINDYDDL